VAANALAFIQALQQFLNMVAVLEQIKEGLPLYPVGFLHDPMLEGMVDSQITALVVYHRRWSGRILKQILNRTMAEIGQFLAKFRE
jgi:hypothetical protein